MTSSTVKRSAFKTFMNTGTTETPVWSLLGDGVTSGAINYNPQTLEETYIHQDNGSTEVESYKPTLPIEATAKAGDPVFDFVDALRQSRAVLDAARAEIVNVWLYETPTAGEYPAEKQTVSIQIDDFGGDGGSNAKINYTINFIGDPTLGTFNPTTSTFTPNP
jgi:hypothetical protein